MIGSGWIRLARMTESVHARLLISDDTYILGQYLMFCKSRNINTYYIVLCYVMLCCLMSCLYILSAPGASSGPDPCFGHFGPTQRRGLVLGSFEAHERGGYFDQFIMKSIGDLDQPINDGGKAQRCKDSPGAFTPHLFFMSSP